MNYITFYYIPGISRIDTPVFDTVENRDMFLSECEPYSVANNSFYPPHFKNRILLNVDNVLNFKTSYNYLALEYDSKPYFYFIDSIEYISEDVIAFNVTMDVIQTYMFNIEIISAEVERESIKRWLDSTTINRNYIRENISEGDMKLAEVTCPPLINFKNKLDNTSLITGWIVAKKSDSNASPVFVKNDNIVTLSNYEYYLYPVINDEIKTLTRGTGGTNPVYIKDSSYSTFEYPLDYGLFLNEHYDTDTTVSIYYIPGNPFLGITVTYAASAYHIVFDDTAGLRVQVTGSGAEGVAKGIKMLDYTNGKQVNISALKYNLSFSTRFVHNTSRTIDFNWKYIPQLLDSNYYRIDFGEKTESRSTYPMEYAYDVSLGVDLELFSDFTTGSRMYHITCSFTDVTSSFMPLINVDKLNIAAYNSKPICFDIVTDAWKHYVSYNGMSLAGAWATGIVNAVSGFAHSKNPVGGVVNAGTQGLRPIIGELTNMGNAALSPDTPRVIGEGNYAYQVNMFRPIMNIYFVRDMEQSAEYFETNGYLVNMHTHDRTLNSFSNRYYYDVIKLKDIVLYLNGAISDESTMDAIKERLSNGIRLWHSTDGVLHCEDEGIRLGQVCVYDNVEV